MTVLEVLTAATGYLKQHGIESPRLNAEHLLAHVLAMPKRIDLYMAFERPVSETERAPLRELVRRRSEGVPLQHLLGTVEFLGRTFQCDARGLIARPETEQLVENLLKRCPAAGFAIADVGTGSGVIAVTIALERPEAAVTAVDLSTDALALAKENADRHGVGERISWLESDLLAGASGPFDAIVANLPYIPTGEIPNLSREVQRDPVMALDGGPDGLDLIRRLVADCPRVLAPGGLLALEIGHDQASGVAGLLEENNFRDIERIADYQGVQRFVIARHG